MEFNLTTPALLFPAISLLMLAYTNRFIVIAQLIRDLHSKNQMKPDEKLKEQIKNLQKRIKIIRSMQLYGAFSFFLCVVSMFFIFRGKFSLANFAFEGSLILLLISLALLIIELQVSVNALTIQLNDFS